jgi:hypothetical protein
VLIVLFSHSQGDADRPRPRTHQGTQVGSARDDKAEFVEGATSGGKRSGDRGAAARHGCDHGAAAGRGSNGRGRGGGNRDGLGVANTCPHRG